MDRTDRSRRVAEQIKRNLSDIIRNEMNDPRLGLVGISDVRLSRDYKVATVYITVLSDEDVKDSMAALNSAANFLRRELSHSLNQRSTPRLEFQHDESIRDGLRLTRLIDSL